MLVRIIRLVFRALHPRARLIYLPAVIAPAGAADKFNFRMSCLDRLVYKLVPLEIYLIPLLVTYAYYLKAERLFMSHRSAQATPARIGAAIAEFYKIQIIGYYIVHIA